MPAAADYRSFWPIYLAAHRRAGTRALHMLGSALALVLLAAALATARPILALAALLIGYGFAWASHALIEHNRPATFDHPLWSFLSDVRMLFLWLRGGLDAELRRHGIDQPRSRQP
jgi:hypothetical protein